MTISELYQYEVERFEEEHVKAYKSILSEEILQNGNPWFNAFLRQTCLNICDQEIEKLEGEKKKILQQGEGIDEHYLRMGFNLALQQEIEYWKREKEIIK